MDRGETHIWTPPRRVGFSEQISAQMATDPVIHRLAAGEWLFRQGEAADRAYLVRSGRLDVVVERPREVVVRQVRRGMMIGELALLTERLRTASARAARDTEVAELGREQFERLMHSSPGFALELTRAMATQIAEHQSTTVPQVPPQTVAVVALDPGAPAAECSATLAKALAAYGDTDELRPQDYGPDTDYRELLQRAEGLFEHLVLAAGSPARDDRWQNVCLHEADLVIAVTRGTPSPAWLERAAVLRGCELVVVDASITTDAQRSLAPRDVHIVRGRTALSGCIQSIARRIAGRSVGLVLSGGGARALAHIGVLQELEEAGIVIDRLAGASMGAIVSGLSASGASGGEIVEMCKRLVLEHNPSNDYTLPAYSLIRGSKARRALGEVFGERVIEELPRRWFCVASDLVARELIVHRTGRIADAIYSSMAIPGIYPPIPTSDGRLLVDGGVMDNLPIEPMAERAEGPIIAVDVSQRLSMPQPAARPGVERLARLARRWITGHDRPVPRLRETIHWTIALGSRDTVAAGIRHADLVITPQVETIGILDWKQLPSALELGRAAARDALAAAPATIEAWRR